MPKGKDSTVIVYAKRTPIGKLCGGLGSIPAPQLGAILVRDALAQTMIPGTEVDEILMGQVLTAGSGQAPARQAAIYGGLPNSVCATTLNRVCGSGMKAVMLADQAIRLGDSRVIFAGGQENMTMAPHMLMGSRNGFRFGPVEMKDHMQWDGLWDPYNNVAMGNCGEICAKEYGFTRAAQDEYTLETYKKAREAIEAGLFADEIVSVSVKNKKETISFDIDEEPFSVALERITELRPVFQSNGTITAGNASSINDGAAMLVLMGESEAKTRGLKPLARILAQASVAQDPTMFTTAPIVGIKRVLAKAELSIDAIDLFEINEAFAVVPMAAMHTLKIPASKVNIRGGAVALGHPIGASGARITVSLIHALRAQSKQRGIAAICIGGGEASCLLIELV